MVADRVTNCKTEWQWPDLHRLGAPAKSSHLRPREHNPGLRCTRRHGRAPSPAANQDGIVDLHRSPSAESAFVLIQRVAWFGSKQPVNLGSVVPMRRASRRGYPTVFFVLHQWPIWPNLERKLGIQAEPCAALRGGDGWDVFTPSRRPRDSLRNRIAGMRRASASSFAKSDFGKVRACARRVSLSSGVQRLDYALEGCLDGMEARCAKGYEVSAWERQSGLIKT